MPPSESPSIEIAVIQRKFNDLSEENYSIDEIECILSNLIYQGWIKGYILHEKALCLSKKDPFPNARNKPEDKN